MRIASGAISHASHPYGKIVRSVRQVGVAVGKPDPFSGGIDRNARNIGPRQNVIGLGAVAETVCSFACLEKSTGSNVGLAGPPLTEAYLRPDCCARARV